MLNRNIPLYEGALPYLYACFSPEDEMLVLPILGRMYNEGFRLWSASLNDKASDFVAVRHVSTSSCVVMFMSHNMLDRINAGIPEVLAACRSSLLRAVVLLDDARPDSRLFALTSPEQLEYQRSNDSSFWLYAYSADYLERCRGPWPEVKIEMREPTFEDVQEDVIAAEYISLEKIITRGGAKPEKVTAPTRYPNNRGYIAPAPDSLSYEPLQKVQAAKTTHDRDYDDAMSLLNQCADRQVDIIINHTRPGENTSPAKPTLSPIRPLPDSQAELRIIQQELEYAGLENRPERKIDPEVKTKADMVVQPEEKQEVQETEPAMQPIMTLPPQDLSPSAIAAGIAQIADAAELTQQPAPVEAISAEPEPVEGPEVVEVEASLSVDEPKAEKPADMLPCVIPEAFGKSTVQVVVRRQQPAVRVTPMKKRVITEPIRTPAAEERSMPRLSRSPFGSRLRSTELYENIDFEQYVRDIAVSAVSADSTEAEEAPVSRRHFGRAARNAAASAETVNVQKIVARAVSAVEPAQTEPAADVAAPETAAEETASRPSARKSRYPHNSRMLTGLLAALRQERTASEPVEETVDEEPADLPDMTEPMPVVSERHDDLKIIRLSDAISERKVSDLQAAVNKFMMLDSAREPSSAPLKVRTYGYRR